MAVKEELTLQTFLPGLQPERLQEPIRLVAPSTLEEAVVKAERAEHILVGKCHSTTTTGWVRQASYEACEEITGD